MKIALKRISFLSLIALSFSFSGCSQNSLDEHDSDLVEINVISKNHNSVFYENTLSFTNNLLNENEDGSVTVQASYSPSGCLKDTIWTISDSSSIKLDADDNDSSICTLTCIKEFENSLVLTATSKYFSSLKTSINVTYDEGIILSPLVTKVELRGIRTRKCPNYSSFNASNSYKVTDLFEVLKPNIELRYELINNLYFENNNGVLRMKSYGNTTNGGIKVVPVGFEEQAITIPITTSYTTTGSGTSHIYTYWHMISSATCTSPEIGYYECAYCLEHLSETTKGNSLGHSWSVSTKGYAATCTSNGKEDLETCSRCGTTRGGNTISALGHLYSSRADSLTRWWCPVGHSDSIAHDYGDYCNRVGCSNNGGSVVFQYKRECVRANCNDYDWLNY